MRYIDHAPTGRRFSRVGFGCGRLVGGASARTSAALVERALALGITHFDSAPSYGLGLAEDVLGACLRDCQDATIATKVGIGRPSGGRSLSLLRRLLRPLKAVPGLSDRLARSAAVRPAAGLFGEDDIRRSLSESLKRLRRSRLDLVFLHEPGPEVDLAAAGAILRTVTSEGLAACYGWSSNSPSAPAAGFPAYQQRVSLGPTARAGTEALLIRHGALRAWAPALRQALAAAPDLRTWCDRLGFDLADQRRHAALLATAALALHPGGVLLISSSDPQRLGAVLAAIDWDRAEGDASFVTSFRSLMRGHAEP